MRKIIAAITAAVLCVAAMPAWASLIGSTSGPDDSFSINFSFENTGPLGIIELGIAGSTVVGPLDVVWDSVGSPGGTAVLDLVNGEDTTFMTFFFSTFGLNDTFTLSGVDPDYLGGDPGVTIAQLLGTLVIAYYTDGTTEGFHFVDNPESGKGLMLAPAASSVPLPASGALLLGGLALLRTLRRRTDRA